MHEQHLDDIVLRLTDTPSKGEPEMGPWLSFLSKMTEAEKPVTIGLVGKYVELQDAYKSIDEALSRRPPTPGASSTCGLSTRRR